MRALRGYVVDYCGKIVDVREALEHHIDRFSQARLIDVQHEISKGGHLLDGGYEYNLFSGPLVEIIAVFVANAHPRQTGDDYAHSHRRDSHNRANAKANMEAKEYERSDKEHRLELGEETDTSHNLQEGRNHEVPYL